MRDAFGNDFDPTQELLLEDSTDGQDRSAARQRFASLFEPSTDDDKRRNPQASARATNTLTTPRPDRHTPAAGVYHGTAIEVDGTVASYPLPDLTEQLLESGIGIEDALVDPHSAATILRHGNDPFAVAVFADQQGARNDYFESLRDRLHLSGAPTVVFGRVVLCRFDPAAAGGVGALVDLSTNTATVVRKYVDSVRSAQGEAAARHRIEQGRPTDGIPRVAPD
ncbi:hypothetical protein AAFP35_25565 [Gordonia sp. CPCC 206044]|uniref:hypothetical protein n=1 Tax=Gordonia sp. CPCC 206044 TaxID=3140793 RepID=UPI003AF39B54